MNSPFGTEAQLRLWVKKAAEEHWHGQARWIEPTLGSTQGQPDCWLPAGSGKVVWLELKIGFAVGEYLRWSFTKEQPGCLRQMLRDLQKVGVLLAGKDTDRIWLIEGSEALRDIEGNAGRTKLLPHTGLFYIGNSKEQFAKGLKWLIT